MVVGVGNNFFGTAVYVSSGNFNSFDAEFVNALYKILPVNLSLFGIFIALFIYIFKAKFLFSFKTSSGGKRLYSFLNRKWLIDKICNEYLSQFFFKFSYSTSYKFVDKGIVEILGPKGLSYIVLNTSLSLHVMQTGFIYHYTLQILIGLSLFFCLRETWLIFEFLVDHRLWLVIFLFSFFIILEF